MKRGRSFLLPILALVLTVSALGWLFKVRLGGGEVYPQYSSLRADPLGTLALYEGLEGVPSLTVSRNFHPLETLKAAKRVELLAGLNWEAWKTVPAGELRALDGAVAKGTRLVLAFRADLVRNQPLRAAPKKHGKHHESPNKDGNKKEASKDDDEESGDDKPSEEKSEKVEPSGSDPKEAGPKGTEADSKPEAVKKSKVKTAAELALEPKDLSKEWGVTFKQRWLFEKDHVEAERVAEPETGLPDEVAWKSDVYFEVGPDSGWSVLYRRSGEAVAIERHLGAGSVVLLADAYCLSNEAVERDRATGLYSYLIGHYTDVEFHEGTLGVLEENGIGHLARRYGLGGALALCVLLGLLYAWRRLVAFLPPRDEAGPGEAEALEYQPTAGLMGLLRRSLPPQTVASSCVEEWKKSHSHFQSSAGRQRLESAWASRDPKAALAATYNALVNALKPH